MNTTHNGFIAPLLLALIALLLAGGAYVYIQNKQSDQPAVVSSTTQATTTSTVQKTATSTQQNQTSSISDWKTYVNRSFTIEYPSSVALSATGPNPGSDSSYTATSTKDLYESVCIGISSPTIWVAISSPDSGGLASGPCGSTGLGMAGTPLDAMGNDIVTVDGKRITALHRGSFFEFTLGSSSPLVNVEYSTDATTTNGIQADLDSIHTIFSTLKLAPNFTPPSHPEIPG